jgi:hypothetical protein
LLSVTARDKGEPERQTATGWWWTRQLAWAIGAIAMVEVALVRPLVDLLLPPAWSDVAGLVEILGFGLMVDVLGWVAPVVMRARGDLGAVLTVQIVSTLTFFPAVTIGAVLAGDRGVAVAVALHAGGAGALWCRRAFFGRAGTSERSLGELALPFASAIALVGGAGAVAHTVAPGSPLLLVATVAGGVGLHALLWWRRGRGALPATGGM